MIRFITENRLFFGIVVVVTGAIILGIRYEGTPCDSPVGLSFAIGGGIGFLCVVLVFMLME